VPTADSAPDKAFDEVDGALRVERPLHVDAQKIIKARARSTRSAPRPFANSMLISRPSCVSLPERWRAALPGRCVSKNLEISIAGSVAHQKWWQHFREIIEAA